MPDRDASGKSSRASLAALVIAAVVSAAGTWAYLFHVYLPAFNTPHTSIEGVPHPARAMPHTAGLARRLVVVLADGLSYDVARDLEELGPLRRAGVFRRLIAEFPTYTSPALTALVTGLGPRDSGVRLNGDASGVEGIDGFVDEALAAKVPVTVWTREFPLFSTLMRADRADVAPGRLRFVADFAVRAALAPADSPLTGREAARAVDLVHIDETDHAGHEFGAASPEYAEAAHIAGAIAARIAASLDLRQDTIVVVSDHGHRAMGGHGGIDGGAPRAFLLIAGGFARSGVELGPARMPDVASTLSVLAGVHVPTSNLGRPLLDALSLSDQEHAMLLASPFDEASAFSCAVAPTPRCADADALTERLRRGDAEVWPAAEALLDDLASGRDRGLTDRARASLERRGIFAASIAAVAAIALILTRRRWWRGGGVAEALPASVFLTIVAAVLMGYGYGSSFSALKPASYFYKDVTLANGAGVAASLVTGRLVRSGPLAAWLVLAGAVVPFAMLAAWVGADPWILPPPAWGVLLFECAPAVLGAAVTAIALAVLAPRFAKA